MLLLLEVDPEKQGDIEDEEADDDSSGDGSDEEGFSVQLQSSSSMAASLIVS